MQRFQIIIGLATARFLIASRKAEGVSMLELAIAWMLFSVQPGTSALAMPTSEVAPAGKFVLAAAAMDGQGFVAVTQQNELVTLLPDGAITSISRMSRQVRGVCCARLGLPIGVLLARDAQPKLLDFWIIDLVQKREHRLTSDGDLWETGRPHLSTGGRNASLMNLKKLQSWRREEAGYREMATTSGIVLGSTSPDERWDVLFKRFGDTKLLFTSRRLQQVESATVRLPDQATALAVRSHPLTAYLATASGEILAFASDGRLIGQNDNQTGLAIDRLQLSADESAVIAISEVGHLLICDAATLGTLWMEEQTAPCLAALWRPSAQTALILTPGGRVLPLASHGQSSD